MLVEYQRPAQRARHRLTGHVVHCRPQPAGADQQVGPFERLADHGRDTLLVIAHHRLAEQANADTGQLARQIGAVGIDRLAQQQLRANRDDLSVHRNSSAED